MNCRLFEEEEIKGYEGLEIDVFFTPSFQALIDVKYAFRDKSATDLSEPFKQTFEAGFFTEKKEFDDAFEKEPPLKAEDLGSCLVSAETTEGTTFKVFHSNLESASERLRFIHAHLQPLLLFYVDAACTIDTSDPKWELLLAVECNPDESIDVVGFATIYGFYVYPDNVRLRLSQVLVLPSHQGRGVGSLLLDALYNLAERLHAVDITLEDPTDDLRRMKDKKDLIQILQKEWLVEEASTSIKRVLDDKGKGKAQDNGILKAELASPLAPSTEILARMQSELCMGRQQARRMWEALVYERACSLGPAATAAAEGLIRATMEAAVASAKQGTSHKAIEDTESGFVMLKSKKKIASGWIPVEGMTQMQQQEALDKAVDARLTEIRRLVLGERLEEEEEET